MKIYSQLNRSFFMSTDYPYLYRDIENTKYIFGNNLIGGELIKLYARF